MHTVSYLMLAGVLFLQSGILFAQGKTEQGLSIHRVHVQPAAGLGQLAGNGVRYGDFLLTLDAKSSFTLIDAKSGLTHSPGISVDKKGIPLSELELSFASAGGILNGPPNGPYVLHGSQRSSLSSGLDDLVKATQKDSPKLDSEESLALEMVKDVYKPDSAESLALLGPSPTGSWVLKYPLLPLTRDKHHIYLQARYLDDGAYALIILKPDATREFVVFDEATSRTVFRSEGAGPRFDATDDGSKIFFVRGDEIIRYDRGSNKASAVAKIDTLREVAKSSDALLSIICLDNGNRLLVSDGNPTASKGIWSIDANTGEFSHKPGKWLLIAKASGHSAAYTNFDDRDKLVFLDPKLNALGTMPKVPGEIILGIQASGQDVLILAEEKLGK